MKKIIVLTALIVVILAPFTFAEGSEFLGGAFTDDGLSARPAGLGGAFTALADDGNASWWNPAGMALMEAKSKNMSLTYVPNIYQLTEGGVSKFLVSYGQGDITGYGALGASISYLTATMDASYSGERENAWTEYVILASWAMQLDKYLGMVKYEYPKIAVGINVKYLGIKSDLTLDDAEISASGFGADVGIMFAIKNNLRIGIMGRDVFTQISWNSGTAELVPYSINAGAFYGITNDVLLSAEIKTVQAENGAPKPTAFAAGFEYGVKFSKKDQLEKIAARAGLNYDINNDSYIISGGASVYLEGFSIDYTYQHFMKTVLADSMHSFGISVSF